MDPKDLNEREFYDVAFFKCMDRGDDAITASSYAKTALNNRRACFGDHGGVDMDVLKLPLEELELSEHSFSCLVVAGVSRIGDLVRRSEVDVLRVPNIGKKSFQEIKKMLRARGLCLGMKIHDLSGGIAS